jgi:hypothetical protein
VPLTLRQLFYILVGRLGYAKTETAYDRLGETLNKARCAATVAMDAIRDDGFTHQQQHFRDADDFLEAVRATAGALRSTGSGGNNGGLSSDAPGRGRSPFEQAWVVSHWVV